MMLMLHHIVLFLILLTACMRHNLQRDPAQDYSEADIPPSSSVDSDSLRRSDEKIYNQSSSSSELTTIKTMNTIIPLSKVFDEDLMLGDDPSVYDKINALNQLTTEHSMDSVPGHFPDGTPQGFSSTTIDSEGGRTTNLTAEFLNHNSENREIVEENPSPVTNSFPTSSQTPNSHTQYADKSIDKSPTIYDTSSDFALNYSTMVFKKDEDIVIYPISVANLMLLTSYGACSCTWDTIDSILNLSDKLIDFQDIKTFIDELSIETDGLLIDQRMFIADDIKLLKKFSGIVRRISNSSLQRINFHNDQESTQIINNWCANRTDNIIMHVMSAGEINNATNMVLISVATFNSSWLKPFDFNRTKLMDFFNGTIHKKVPTMNQEIRCRHGVLGKLNNSTYVELYVGAASLENPMRMIIILPPENTSLSNLVPNLRKFKFKDLGLENVKDILVNISLPKFRIRTKITLKDYRKLMGMDNIFSDMANFRRITKTRNLKVNDFIQMSIIDVNEGHYRHEKELTTEKKILDSSIFRENFHVNRPFFVLIANNHIIFAVAQVVNPTS